MQKDSIKGPSVPARELKIDCLPIRVRTPFRYCLEGRLRINGQQVVVIFRRFKRAKAFISSSCVELVRDASHRRDLEIDLPVLRTHFPAVASDVQYEDDTCTS